MNGIVTLLRPAMAVAHDLGYEPREHGVIRFTYTGKGGKLIGLKIIEKGLDSGKLLRPSLLVVIPDANHELGDPTQELIRIQDILDVVFEELCSGQ